MKHLRPSGVALAVAAGIAAPYTHAADPQQLEALVRELAAKVERLETELAVAREAGTVAPAPQPQVQEIDQKVKVLERKLEIAAEEAAAAKKATPVVTASDKGFAISSPDKEKAFQFKLRGTLHADYRSFQGESGDDFSDTALLRRVRPSFEGTVFEKYDFRIMPEFANNSASLLEGYIDARFQPWAKVRAGKFKGPVGLERLQSASDIRFIERGLPTNLVPNRELGIQLHGDVLDGGLGYAIGVFNGVNDGRSSDDFGTAGNDSNDSKDLEGRIFGFPFKNSDIYALQGLGLGIAGTWTDVTGTPPGATASRSTLLPAYVTGGQNGFFAYRNSSAGSIAAGTPDGAYGVGERYRIAPQAYWYYGPYGLLAEYVSVTQDVQRDLAAGAVRDSLTHQSWQIQAAWVVTGEDNSYKSVKPAAPFKIGDAGWGALELVARYGELDIDDDAFEGGGSSFANPTNAATKASAWALGANWYLNSNLKFVLNYEQTRFDGGAGTALAPEDRDTEKALFARAQIAY